MSFLIVFTLLFVLGCGVEDKSDKIHGNELMTTIEYKKMDKVNPNLLSLDIYYNSTVDIKKPIVVYVHGGGWCKGDKANNIENKVKFFQSLNYIFISVNYRLSPFPFDILDDNRIKYPDHNMDIADALLWIHDNISKYGGDKNKIVLIGHSAGAHLVALTGTNKRFLESKGLDFKTIKGVAVIDTVGFDIKEQIENGNNPKMYLNAFGSDSVQNMDASPIHHVVDTISYPKFFIAKRGNPKRIKYVDDFIHVLEENDVSVYQVDGSIYDHQGINDVIGKPDEKLINSALKSFLVECFE